MDSIIIKYLESTATEEEMKFLHEWINASAENKKHFFDTRAVWLASQDSLLETYQTDEAFERFKMKALSLENKPRPTIGNSRIWAVAASIALLVASTVTAYWLGSRQTYLSDNTNQLTAVKENVLYQTVIRNSKTSFQLPDGTTVWLNGDSKLTYPERFSAEERIVRLEGEAFFEVVRNEQTPFFVETEDMSIKVLGTSFGVISSAEAGIHETILLTGKVEVNSVRLPEPVMLYPNQKLAYDKMKDGYLIEKVDADEYTLWRKDKLIMNDEPLSSIFKKMERWYGVNIVCQGKIPLNTRYSITITDEPKEEILRLLSIYARIDYKMENKKVVITKK